MEINVTKNLLTGESTVLSTASVPTEELNKHTGLKVFDDGRKCVYALNSQEVLSLTIYSNFNDSLLFLQKKIMKMFIALIRSSVKI